MMKRKGEISGSSQAAVYEIKVQGRLDDSWAAWFGGMAMVCRGAREGEPITILTGAVADQSALRGLLSKIWDLNLAIVSIGRIE